MRPTAPENAGSSRTPAAMLESCRESMAKSSLAQVVSSATRPSGSPNCQRSCAVSCGGRIMGIIRRIYVSLAADPWLPPNLNDLKWGIVGEIETRLYAEIFTNPKGMPGLASAKAWNPRDAEEINRRCLGRRFWGCRVGASRTAMARRCCCPPSSITMKVLWSGRLGCRRWCWCRVTCCAGWCSTAALAATWGSTRRIPG